MAEAKLKELRCDIDEMTELLKQAKRKKVQDTLSLEIRKMETEWINLNESIQAAPAPKNNTADASAALSQQKRYQIKLNGYGWDQSDKYVKIFITLKNVQNVPKEQIYCKLTERSMELHVENLDNKDYVLIINNLLESINVEDSHWKQKAGKTLLLNSWPLFEAYMFETCLLLPGDEVRQYMVVVFLAKAQPNVKWSHMTEIERKFENQRNNRFKTDDMDKKDPQESIMSLMKNMYETGDDEMKRMISKAWYEGQQKKKTDTLDL